jgi:hypothetical protein
MVWPITLWLPALAAKPWLRARGCLVLDREVPARFCRILLRQEPNRCVTDPPGMSRDTYRRRSVL